MFTKWLITLSLSVISSIAVATPDIQSWTTDNGASVLFVEADELPMVDINVVFNAGAARDGDLPGLAKLTNAMLDEGSAKLDADQIAAAFADIGAHYGASSQRDMAVLSLRTLTDKTILDKAVQMFASVLSKPSFPETSFQRIQKQLLIGLQAEKQSPGALASRAFYQGLYANHPYVNMPAGTIESVGKITINDLKRFYQQFYVAKNAVVVIVGAVSSEQAHQLSQLLTADLASGEAAPELPKVAPLVKASQVEIDHPSTQTHILMGQPGISRNDADYFALYVGNHILGGSGLVSLLSDEVREKRGLSYSVYSYFRPMQQLGPYQFGLQTRNDQAATALDVMQNTLKTFIDNGPSEQQIEEAKQNITGGFALRLDSNSKIADYLTMIGFYDLPLDYLDTFNAQINAVTKEQIKDAFSRRVHADKMHTVLVGGKAE